MSTDKQKGKKDNLIAGYHSHRFCDVKQARKVKQLCNSSAQTLFTLTIPPATWARVVIIEINSILTGKLVCFTFSALHLCWTRSLFTLCIPRWTEMCWSLPCLQKGILLLYYLLDFKLLFYTNNTIVYFSGCLWFICRT